MLTAKNICLKLSGKDILTDVSVTIWPGEVHGLVGVSGSGKTTLLNCLGLLLEPSSGSINIDGKNLGRLTDKKRRNFWRNRAAFIFQDYGLIDEDTVIENVCMAGSKMRLKARIPEVMRVLEQVKLADRGIDPVAQLSGGEKQRVGFARALFRKADFIFADEPTASLDDANREIVFDLLRKSAAEGVAIVVATHDKDLVAHCDTCTRLEHGKVCVENAQ